MQALPAFGHTQRNCGYAPWCVACGGSHLSGGCPTPRGQPQCCGCRDNHTANYRGCVKWKEAKAALSKQVPERVRKSTATAQPAAPKAQQAGPSTEHMDLGEGWNHVAYGGHVVKATTTPTPNPNPSPQSVTEVPTQSKVTGTRKARPKKSKPKSTAATKLAAAKAKKKAAASVKTATAKQYPRPGGPHPKFHLPTRGHL